MALKVRLRTAGTARMAVSIRRSDESAEQVFPLFFQTR